MVFLANSSLLPRKNWVKPTEPALELRCQQRAHSCDGNNDENTFDMTLTRPMGQNLLSWILHELSLCRI
jgi:hypothetical protein